MVYTVETGVVKNPCETLKAKAEIISHMLHGDLMDTWDMWLIEVSTELKSGTESRSMVQLLRIRPR